MKATTDTAIAKLLVRMVKNNCMTRDQYFDLLSSFESYNETITNDEDPNKTKLDENYALLADRMVSEMLKVQGSIL